MESRQTKAMSTFFSILQNRGNLKFYEKSGKTNSQSQKMKWPMFQDSKYSRSNNAKASQTADAFWYEVENVPNSG